MTEIYINKKNLKELEKDIGEYRLKHSLGVMEEAGKLCEKYGCDISKGKIAGLFHDCGKFNSKKKAYEYIEKNNITIDSEFLKNYQLLHPELGYIIGKNKYKIDDEEILSAIRYHTTLRENPSLLDKIIYIADAIEPNRDFDGVEELRELAYKDLDKAVLYSLERTILDLIKKEKYIGIRSLKARNYLLENFNND